MTTVSAIVVFGVALTVSLVATPLLRRLAVRTDFIDQPGAHKSHSTPVPYLGGVAIMAGTVAGSAVGHRLGVQALVIGLAAACLGSMGLFDDSRHLSAHSRLVIQLVAALAVAGFGGVRAEVSGIAVFDVAFTVVWILAITNAVNFLDNMDGLAAGITAAAGMAIFATGILSGQTFVATVALAMVGACFGFLPFNAPPAKIYMGDAGSLFLGFLLAVLTLDVKPDLVPPASFVVPAMLVALPVLDIITVTISRLRRGISVSTGGRNHLSHRLVARGLSRPTAVAILIGVEAVVAALAILPNQDPASLTFSLLGALVVLGGLTAFTFGAPVHDEPVTGFARPVRLMGWTACVSVLGAALPAMLALLGARADLGTGASGYQSAMAAACRGDRDEAAFMLQRSSQAFARADARLSNPVVSLGLAVPVVNSNLAAARALADTGQASPRQTGLRIGLVSTTDGPLTEETGALASSSGPLSPGQDLLKDLDAPFLMPQLRDAVVHLDSALAPHTLARAGSCPGLVGPEQVRSSPGEPSYVLAAGEPGSGPSGADASSRSSLPENVSSALGPEISLIRSARGSDGAAVALGLRRANAPVPAPIPTALGSGAPVLNGPGAPPAAGPVPRSTPPRSTPPKPTPPRSTPRQNDNTRPRPVSPKPVFEPPRPSGGRSVHAAGGDPAPPKNRGQGNRDRDGENKG
jgi:UDP-GlcNAc:undecaprenyl-phosphate GlcNAc-1-phosphate transferase